MTTHLFRVMFSSICYCLTYAYHFSRFIAQNQLINQFTYLYLHILCIRKLILAHSKLCHCRFALCLLGGISLYTFTATFSGDNVTSKLNVGTGKTGYPRTRDHLTRTRPDP